MRIDRINLPLTVIFIITILTVRSQEIVPVNFQTVLELGGAQNLTIKEYEEMEKLAAARLSEAKEWWLPEIYAGTEVHQLWGAAMNSDGRFFLDVNRNSLWNGLGINANWNFSEGIYQQKAEQLKTQAAGYQTQTERNKALLECIYAYYNLVSTQQKYTSYVTLVAQADTIIEQLKIQVDAGLRYQSELLLAKSNKNHLNIELLNARKEFNTHSDELARLLHIEGNVQLVSTDTEIQPLELQDGLLEVSDSTYTRRPEIQYNIIWENALQTERKMITNGLFIPQLNFNTYGSYAGKLIGPVSPMFPDLYPETRQLYPTGVVNVSLLWRVPLGQFIYSGEVKRYNSLIALQQLKSEQLQFQINEEINVALYKLSTGKEQIQLAKEALELTVEALFQSLERQKLGTAIPFEVFQAQQFYLQAHIDYIENVSEYNKAQFALKVAKGESL